MTPSPEMPATEGGNEGGQSGSPLEAIRARSEQLKASVEAARRAKQIDITNRLSERKQLIGESKRTADVLNEAQTHLAYFDSLTEREKEDPKIASPLAELQATVAGLEQQQTAIRSRTDQLSNQPDVNEELIDSATAEGKDRDAEKRFQGENERILAAAEKLGQDIVAAGEEEHELVQKLNAMGHPSTGVETLMHEAQEMLSHRDYDTFVQKSGEDWSAVKSRLESRRGQLGLFGHGDMKKAIDYLLDHGAEFAKADALTKERDDLMSRSRELWETRELADRYDRLIADSETAQREYKETTGKGKLIDASFRVYDIVRKSGNSTAKTIHGRIANKQR